VNLYDNSEITTGVTVAQAKEAMRVLEAIGHVLEPVTDGTSRDIYDSLNMSYAFLNATIQHQERLNADFDNKPHGWGQL